jgi:sortase B
MRKKLVLAILLTLSLLVLAAGGYVLGQRAVEYAEGDEDYSGLEVYVSFHSSSPDTDEPDSVQQTETPQTQSTAPSVDFAELSRMNPDIVGWLYCEGTKINYPVVQGSDDEYYLDHLFDGTQNANGCLFLDSRVGASFSSVHSIIYGHHMRSGAMFAALDGYKRQSFYETHPTMLLITPAATYEVQLFTAYVADPSEDAWEVSFANDGEIQAWIDAAIARSTFTSDVKPTPGDRLLTLSTCSYEFGDARFVVVGILIK